jgi:hypothetical protein
LSEVIPYLLGYRFFIMHSVFSSSAPIIGFHPDFLTRRSFVLESFPAETGTDAQSQL